MRYGIVHNDGGYYLALAYELDTPLGLKRNDVCMRVIFGSRIHQIYRPQECSVLKMTKKENDLTR